MKNPSLPAHCAAVLFVGTVFLPLRAADWPQWQGPDRSNVSTETSLLKEWPPNGPKLLWIYTEAGAGYSGPAIVGDRLYAMGADQTKEYLFALDLKTRKQIWRAEVGPRFVNGWGDGPRSTPTVDGDLVFALGGQGNLVCVKAGSGDRLWTKNMQRDFGGKMMSGWGYTESPLVDGGAVVCTPGGKDGAVVSLDKNTGELRWRSKDFTDEAAYSSLVVSEAGGIRQYVQRTGKSVSGVAAKDGRLLWSFPHKAGTAAIPTPIVSENYVFSTSGYGAGCVLIRLTPNGDGLKAEKVYANKDMSNHHGGVVKVGNYLYGYTDAGGGGWMCMEFLSGKVLWKDRSKLGKGSITCADDRLYCYSESNGTVVLLEANNKGWKESGRFKVSQVTKLKRKAGKIWTHPVVANGRLYLRDQEILFCYEVK